MSGYLFEILDEIIEDLKTGHSGKMIHGINRMIGLRNSNLNSVRHLDGAGKRYEYKLEICKDINRIVRRLYSDDIEESIEMMRELQDEIYGYEGYTNNSARFRFENWKVIKLNGTNI